MMWDNSVEPQYRVTYYSSTYNHDEGCDRVLATEATTVKDLVARFEWVVKRYVQTGVYGHDNR